MRKVLLSWLLVLAGAAGARGQDDPRALVTRALAAQGGEALVVRGAVRVAKIRGTLGFPHEGPVFEGEIYSGSRGRIKSAMRLEAGGVRLSVTQALDGSAGWRAVDARIEDVKGPALTSLQDTAYLNRVLDLVALLHDPALTLAPLGEATVDGRPARGVKVTTAGRPDVSLYFDRATHLLVKYAYRERDPASKNEVLNETVLSDYREPDLGAEDEKALKAAGQAVTGPALLDYLRRRTPPAVDAAGVRRLVRELGDDSFEVRQKATAGLRELGPAALPWLRAAANDADAEVSRRARECLERIEEPADARLLPAAVRLAALRAPDGAAEVLLALLARSREEDLVRELRAALAAVAVRDGKPDAALARALTDGDPERQTAAAAALGRDGGAYLRQPGRRLYLTGLKLPLTSVTYADGKKFVERRVLAVEFFNDFEDGMFARPQPSRR